MSNIEEAGGSGEMTREEVHSVLFAQLIIQQSNMAMMLLGKVPHPESGQQVKDLESAQFFIDQLEMLQAKTRGNLSKEEEAMLKQSLMTLRLAYVEAVNSGEAPKSGAASQGSTQPKAEPVSHQDEKASAAGGDPAQEGAPEHRPKFSKKY